MGSIYIAMAGVGLAWSSFVFPTGFLPPCLLFFASHDGGRCRSCAWWARWVGVERQLLGGRAHTAKAGEALCAFSLPPAATAAALAWWRARAPQRPRTGGCAAGCFSLDRHPPSPRPPRAAGPLPDATGSPLCSEREWWARWPRRAETSAAATSRRSRAAAHPAPAVVVVDLDHGLCLLACPAARSALWRRDQLP